MKGLLHQYYKQLKVGLITWEEVPEKYQRLLRFYYRMNYLSKKY